MKGLLGLSYIAQCMPANSIYSNLAVLSVIPRLHTRAAPRENQSSGPEGVMMPESQSRSICAVRHGRVGCWPYLGTT